MSRLLEELTREEKSDLVYDIYKKKTGELDDEWADIVENYDLDMSGETLRKAGVGVKLAYDAGVVADHDGTRILAEIHFSYGSDPLLLEEHARRVADAAAALTQEAPGQGEEGCRLLCSRLAELNHYSPNGAASVFSALISGGADSEGMALAFQLLCQESGIECLPVSGTLDGAPHWWSLVKVNGVWRHVDVTAFSAGRDFLFTDSQMSPRYVWQKEQYPACKEAEREASAVPSLFP